MRCGNLLRGPRKKDVQLKELSPSTWRRETADIAARDFRVALEKQKAFRDALEKHKTAEHKTFVSDMKKCNDRLDTEGNPHDGLVMAKLDARAVAIQCAHGYHIRCSHTVRGRQ